MLDVLNSGRRVQDQIINVLLSSIGAFNSKMSLRQYLFGCTFASRRDIAWMGPDYFKQKLQIQKLTSELCHASSRPRLCLKGPRQVNVEAFKVSAQFPSESPIVIEMI